MTQDMLQRAIKYVKENTNKKRWKKIVFFLAAIVVFCTTYALILPAITMEKDKSGMEEHTHTEECYEVQRGELICTQSVSEGHTHEEACYDENGELICQLEESSGHQHTDDCYAQEKVLICGLSETTGENEDNDGEGGISPLNGDEASETKTLALTVTSIIGSGTTYDPYTEMFETDLRIEFEFVTNQIEDNAIYVYTYTKGIIVPDTLLNQEKDLYDSSGVKAGVYVFVKNDDGTYSVQIRLDDSYVQGAGNTITGYVQFSGELNASTEGDGSIKIVGGDNLTLTIPAEKITYPESETDNYDIDVSKSGSYVVEGDKLVYTVYVRSYKGTPDPINFEDTITPNGLALERPTVTVEKGYRYYFGENAYYEGSDFETVSVNPTYEDGTITMFLGQLTQETVTVNNQEQIKIGFYKITYTYDITDMEGIEVSPENEVTVSAVDEIKQQTVSDEDESTVKINKNYSMNKSGWYNSSTGKIQWTIQVNSNGANIAGAKLTDTMFGKLSGANDLTFLPEDGNYEVSTDSDGKITGVVFKGIGDTDVNINTYTITYYTDVEAGWDEQKITNSAVLDPTPGDDDFGDEITGESSVNVGGGSVAKSMDGAVISADGKTAEVTWTVTLTVPESGLPAGTIIEDDVTKNQWGNQNTFSQWMTRSQITDWACNLYWRANDGTSTGGTNTYTVPGTNVTFLASDGNTYTYNQINENEGNFAENLTFTVFTIQLDKDLTPPSGSTQLYFTYTTTVDLEYANIGSNTYYNSVNVGDKSDGAEYVYRKAGVKKTDGNGNTGTTTITSDGTVTWKIVATLDDQNRKKLTLTDTLPDGVELEALRLTGWGNLDVNLTIADGTISGTDSTGQYNIVGTYTGSVITLDISPESENGIIQNNSEFTLTVTAKVTDAEKQTETKTLTNKAEMKLDDKEIGSSEQTQNWSYDTTTEEAKVVDKSGVWDNDSRHLKYSIILNPEEKDLVEDADTLTLTDELTYYPKATVYTSSPQHDVTVEVTLIQSSVKLYKAVKAEDGTWIKGEEIKNWSWTYSSQKAQYNDNIIDTIVGNGIPDSTSLILEYDYIVHSSAEKDDQFTFSVRNAAELEGTSYSDKEDHTQEQWKEQTSSAGVTTEKTFTLYKVEAGNYNNELSGAIFSVYAYDTLNDAYRETAIKTYTTDNSGKFQIRWNDGGYEYNTLYKVVETSPPTGYKLPDTVQEYYFYFSSDTNTDNTLPDDLPNEAVDLSKADKTVYAENIKNTTDITVEKKWKDKDGNEDVHNSGSITLNLYRKKNSSSGSSGGISYLITGNVNGEAQWEGTFDDVTIGDEIKISLNMNWPGMDITWDGVSNGSGNWNWNEYIYEYTCTVTSNTISINVGASIYCLNTVSHDVLNSTNTGDTDSSGQDNKEDELVKTVTVTSSDNWRYTFTDLPISGIDEDGNTVNYYYYIQENSVSNYTTSYENNDGIAEGTIVVINTADENPEYTLPDTGGTGTNQYIWGGLLLIAGASFLLVYKYKRRKEDVASS